MAEVGGLHPTNDCRSFLNLSTAAQLARTLVADGIAIPVCTRIADRRSRVVRIFRKQRQAAKAATCASAAAEVTAWLDSHGLFDAVADDTIAESIIDSAETEPWELEEQQEQQHEQQHEQPEQEQHDQQQHEQQQIEQQIEQQQVEQQQIEQQIEQQLIEQQQQQHEPPDCPICYEALGLEPELECSACTKIFHMECMRRIVAQEELSNKCPLCRTRLSESVVQRCVIETAMLNLYPKVLDLVQLGRSLENV